MKRYLIHRDPTFGRVRALVVDGEDTYPLPHLKYHSPDGFEYGYGGSGPSDLARSIVGDLLGTKQPSPRLYQKVKWELIANVDQERPRFLIREEDVRRVIEDRSGSGQESRSAPPGPLPPP